MSSGCPPWLKTPLAYALNSLASDPSPFRRCFEFLHFHSHSNMRGKVALCLSLPPQIMRTRLFSEYIKGWAVFSLNMSLIPVLIFRK